MRRAPVWTMIVLLSGSTSCAALLGATDVPDPDDAGNPAEDGRASSDDASRSSSGSGTSSSGGPSSGEAGGDGWRESSSESSSGSSGGDATSDSGCGPLTTTTNCGACGIACNTSTGVPMCAGTTCTYACNPGRLDCNAVDGPDTDGCECTTPACCGINCQTTHDDGLGHKFYDCNPLVTRSPASALAACQAYAVSIHANINGCSTDWNCQSGSIISACYSPDGTTNACTTCWIYSGGRSGVTTDCYCPPSAQLGMWN